MSDFAIKPATRTGTILLIAVWGGTGAGKTESALRMARGMAGPQGRIGIIDTERKRSGYCLDSIPGGFQRIDFDPPYTPERYVDALEVLEANVDVGVLDSASHAWEGPDGILDLHEEVLDRMTRNKPENEKWSERERLNWPAWREPKMRYKELRTKLLNFKIPLIVCFRGEQKSRMEKDAKGKNAVITDSNTTPIFEKNFVFEAHIAVEMFPKEGVGGYIRYPWPYAKVSHPGIRKILPDAGDGQLSFDTGAKLAEWCNRTDKFAADPKPADPIKSLTAADAELKSVKREIWNITEHIHRGNSDALQQWLHDEFLMGDTEWLKDLTLDTAKVLLGLVKAKLEKQSNQATVNSTP